MADHELLPASDARLNLVSRELGEEEIGAHGASEFVIKAMTAIALGERDEAHPNRPSLVGLAAPQIGAMVRIILFDQKATAGEPNFEPDLQFVINPRITQASEQEELGREGCYSTGDIRAAVYRAQSIRLAGLDEQGAPMQLDLTGFQARIAQHEIDHLNGIRCPDRVRDPSHLHLVKPDEFQDYREHWQTWPTHYPIEDWLKLKGGGS